MSFDYQLSTIARYRAGTAEDPYIDVTQSDKVIKQRIVLNEIPVFLNKVRINGMVEVFDVDIFDLEENQFRVDYNEGVLFFHASKEGKTLTAAYSGRGSHFLSAGRVYTEIVDGEIIQTLDSIVQAASSFKSMGEYNSSTQYNTYNMVNYQGVSYMYTAIASSSGNLPTNETYWVKIAGNVNRGVYSTSTTYKFGDIVEHSSYQKLYQSKIGNNLNNPLTDTTKWQLLIDISNEINTINTTNANVSNAESARVTSETGRVNAESSRVSAESSRVSVESSRVTAENTRQSNESTRQNNETTRQSQESTRQTNTTNAINNINATRDSYSYKKEYNNTTAYVVNNQVQYNGTTYICIKNTTGNVPTNATYWSVFAQKGADGQGTVTTLTSSSGDILVGGTPQVPDLSVNSGNGANQIVRRNASGKIDDVVDELSKVSMFNATLKHGPNILNTEQASPIVPTIYGYTLVNLLGYDGNFEKDSNGDGVADGWASFLQGAIASIITTDVIHGTKIQRITSTPEDTALARRLEHRNKTFEAGKYYVVITDAQTDGTAEALLEAVYDATLIAVSSTTSKVLSVKFNPSTTISTGKITIQNRIALGAIGWVQFDGVRLYEIDAATYAKIDVDPEYTGKKLAEKFPYVDGVQHVTCPMITKVGKNMLPPFTEWTLNAGDNIKGPYEVELTSGGAIPAIDTTFSVINGQKYTVSVSLPTNAFMQIRKTNGSAYVNVSGGAGVRTATFTATEDAVIFRRYTTQGGTFLFSNPQLELGSVATPFEPRNDDALFIISDSSDKPLKLAKIGDVRDILTYRDGAWWKLKQIEQVEI